MSEVVYTAIISTAKLGMRALGQPIDITGLEHLPRTGAALLAVNHVGYVDFIYGGVAPERIGRRVRFMAKRELFDHRVSGPIMRACRHIPVDRAVGEASLADACEPRAGRAGRDLPRGDDLAGDGDQGPQDRRRRGSPTSAGVPADPDGAVGHPAADDQGPPPRPLARDRDLDPGRGAGAGLRLATRSPRPRLSGPPSRTCSPRRSRRTPSTRTAPGGCPRRTAAAPPPWSGRPSWTPPSGGSGPSAAPPRKS